ncbi:phage tail terminator-like protein [Bradyrhizobium sp.]|uniref:phage tail terminator-like protein n=1 Tax=Bradyrhizobium sp. TaxID=376 RepID=UPI0039E57F51
MPSKAVSDAFEARLQTWPNLTACPLVEINEVSPVQKPPYLEIEWPAAVEDRMSTGKPAVFRERGGARFIITVATNAAGWKAQVIAWADELRDLFRAQAFGGVETDEVSPAVIDERNREGTKFHVPFAVAYRYDVLK